MPAAANTSLRARIVAAVALLGGLAFLLLAASASAAAPTYRGASADGEVIFFETDAQLVPGDTDFKRDLYARAFDETVGEAGAYVTRQVSVGPTGGNDAYNALFERASSDGSVVFFSTEESLVAADTDRETDVYARDLEAGTTQLVSRGASACQPGCGNGEQDTGFAGATADGAKVFLVTAERLDLGTDTDAAVDVYLRDLVAETTKLVSAGGEGCAPLCGNGSFNATHRGVSADGSRAFFVTAEPLAEADGDEAIDIYARDLPDGPTALVSAGDPECSPCGDGDSDAIFAASSADGDAVFFATDEGLVPADEDEANDVYLRAEGATTRLSGGAAKEPASFVAASADGSRAFFTTAESLVGGEDENEANDVYLWEGGSPQLVTSGSCCGSTFGAATAGGEAVLFTTTEQLVAADTDESADVYEQLVEGGSPELVSAGEATCAPECGNEDASAIFNRASNDGSRVFFTSAEKLGAEDFDEDDDIYLRDLGAETTALSTPPPGLCPTSSCAATFVGASTDATHVVFQTTERLVADDVDGEADIYERAPDAVLEADVTRLVSTGNSDELELGPAAPKLLGTDPASPDPSTEPRLLGEAAAEALIKVYPTASCSGEPVATGTAAELAEPGILVAVETGATATFWATAEAEGFTSLCSNPVSYTQETPPPPPPPPPPPAPPPSESPSGSGSGASAPTASPEPTHSGGVAYVRPVVKITFGPAFKTRSRRPAFRFKDRTGQPGTRFKCRLDRQRRWHRCRSPKRLRKLRGGRHIFRVRAINAVGQPSKRVVRRRFKVVRRKRANRVAIRPLMAVRP